MLKMYFDYRDVFKAARLGLSPKKMWMLLLGLLAGFTFYGIFGYLSHLIAGRSISDIWIMFGLVPAIPWPGAAVVSWIFWTIGVLGALIIYMLSAAAVARTASEQLKGNEFYDIAEARKFIKTNWKSIVGGPLIIFCFVLILIIFGIFLGLWGRIPALGEVSVAILSLPVYFICLFIVFLLVSLAVGLFYSPVICGATKSDTFDNLFETFSAITSQPWRLLIYTTLLKIVALLATAIFAWFTISGISIAFAVLSWAMGSKFTDIAIASFNFYTPPLASNFLLSLGTENTLIRNLNGFLLSAPTLNWSGQAAAFIMGMTLNLIRLAVLSYFFSIFITGQTIIYGTIVMKRDQKNIFEEDKKEQECQTSATAGPDDNIAAQNKSIKKKATSPQKKIKRKPKKKQ